jgi:hypothetical protein
MGYGLKLGLVAIGIAVAFVIGIVLFGRLWVQLGLVAAIVVICIPLLILGWYLDRKERRQREGLEDI